MFTPVLHDLEGLAADRFRSLATQLRRLQRQGAPAEWLDALCRDGVRWAASAAGLNGGRDKYQACARLLTDLAKLRWRIERDGFGIELAAPNPRRVAASEVAAYKDSVRQELASQLRHQFAAKSVRDFIRPMETPAPSAKRCSALQLIADPGDAVGKVVTSAKGCPRINSVLGDGRDPDLRTFRQPMLYKVAA